MAELAITVAIVALCAVVIYTRREVPGTFIPFFYRATTAYKDGLIDGQSGNSTVSTSFQPSKPTKPPETGSMKPEEARNSPTKPKFHCKTASLSTWAPQRWTTFHSPAK